MPSAAPKKDESIDRRFRVIVTALYAVIVGLVLWLFVLQWHGYWDACEAKKEFNVVSAALRAMADVSSERRPTVAVLMVNDAAGNWRQVQQSARRVTDQHMQALGAALHDKACQRCAALLPAWERIVSDLNGARENLDRMRSAKPTDGEIVAAFERIIDLVPRLSYIAETSEMGVIRENADVQSYLLVARLSGLLRAQAGLIAQQFAPALIARRALGEEESFHVSATLGKIEQLRQLLLPSIPLLPRPLQDDFVELDRRYFGQSVSMLHQLRKDAEHRGGSDMTLMQLSDEYGPLVAPINRFRDDALALAASAIDDSLHRHLVYLLASGLFAVALTGFVVRMGRGFRMKVIRPLFEARRFIVDVAAGNMEATLPAEHYGREVTELFGALEVLKANDIKRRHLELERLRLIGELQTMSETDPLTGLLNRRAFETRARVLLADQRNRDSVISLMMLDIDFFKRVNDTYGHESGDKALVKLAELCRETVRSEDIVARSGGEEFVILLRVHAPAVAQSVAEALRQRLHAETVTSTDGQVFGFTASIGIASARHLSAEAEDLAGLLREADALLYRAKQNGRDRIEVSAPI